MAELNVLQLEMIADPTILVFDLGTTNFKAALFSHDGEMLGLVRGSPPIVKSRERAELSVDAMRSTLVALVRELAARCPLDGVRGVSFSSQANSFVLFDAQGAALTPIIYWTDARAREAEIALNQFADLHSTSGVPSVDHEFAAAKLKWIADHEPGIAARAEKISFISDVLVEWLTGVHATEYSLACLTALATRMPNQWVKRRLDTLGLPRVVWPEIRPAGAGIGTICPDVAGILGLPTSVKVYIGCLDQYAGAIGTGAASPGKVCETTGTVLAAVQCVAADSSTPGPSVFEGPSFAADRVFRMTFSGTSANLLEWYRCRHARDRSFDELIGLSIESSTRAKIGDVGSDIANSFCDADLAQGHGHVVKGILHRVCDELALLLAQLDRRVVEVRSAGGAARSDTWLQLKADRLGVPILASSTEEPTCRGAAMLAASGLGLGSIDVLADQWCQPRKVFQPSREGDVRA